jgi:hypothetical protein
MLSRKQILSALRAAARQLGRAPTGRVLASDQHPLWKADSAFLRRIPLSLAQRFCPPEKVYLLTCEI